MPWVLTTCITVLYLLPCRVPLTGSDVAHWGRDQTSTILVTPTCGVCECKQPYFGHCQHFFFLINPTSFETVILDFHT